MKTVNSLSGGKTSSYIAVHYPADIEIFALVCIDSHNAGKHIPRWIKQRVNDKLQKTSAHHREFVATSEDPRILTAMFDLEQKLGREILWVRGIGWEEMLKAKKAIPNMNKRFCTQILKMQPIFEYLYINDQLPCKMRIGYRYDEEHRQHKATTSFKYSQRMEFQPNSNRWINRWEETEWRELEFPLIEDRIMQPHIQNYWEGQGIEFPPDSNCQNCFWKHEQQLRQNWDTNRPIMQWSAIMEDMYDHTFKESYTLAQIKEMAVQLDIFGQYSWGSGCSAGMCTD